MDSKVILLGPKYSQVYALLWKLTKLYSQEPWWQSSRIVDSKSIQISSKPGFSCPTDLSSQFDKIQVTYRDN